MYGCKATSPADRTPAGSSPPRSPTRDTSTRHRKKKSSKAPTPSKASGTQESSRLGSDRLSHIAGVVDELHFRRGHRANREWKTLVDSIRIDGGRALQNDLPVLQSPRAT